MFDRQSWPTITESVVQSADSVVQSAYCSADSGSDLARIGVWVWAFSVKPIFQCNKKLLVLGAPIGFDPKHEYFTLQMPTC